MQPVGDRVGGERPSDEEALTTGDAERAKGGGLVDGLDAFGGDDQAEIVGERGDGADDRSRAGFGQLVDEAAVDLDAVEWQVADVGEGGARPSGWRRSSQRPSSASQRLAGRPKRSSIWGLT